MNTPCFKCLFLVLSYCVMVPLTVAAQGARPVAQDVANPARQSAASNNTASLEAATKAAAEASTKDVPGNQPLNSLAGLGTDYKIGPNDLIDVEVYGVPELKRTVRVNASGLVSLALVGNAQVMGLTAQQAEAAIAKKYAEKYLQDPQVSVFVKEFTTQRITIEGAVARPGIYPVTGQLTLLRAIALAGGGAQYAEMSEIMVFRADKDNTGNTQNGQVFNLEKIRAGEAPDPSIGAEDVIVVKRNPTRAGLRDSLFRDVLDTLNPFSIFSKP